jgi:Tfp pilus assembly protein PilN
MRRTETSTLAFLDVMACGLGAVILILVVLKQQAPIEAAPQPENIISTEQVQADLDRLQDELDELQAARAASQSDLQAQTDRVAKMAVAVEANQHRSGSGQRTN